jgi:hypothetical protein
MTQKERNLSDRNVRGAVAGAAATVARVGEVEAGCAERVDRGDTGATAGPGVL